MPLHSRRHFLQVIRFQVGETTKELEVRVDVCLQRRVEKGRKVGLGSANPNDHLRACHQAHRNKLQQECAGEGFCLTGERLPGQEPNTTKSPRLKPQNAKRLLCMCGKFLPKETKLF